MLSDQYTPLYGGLKDTAEISNSPYKPKGLQFRNAVILFMGVKRPRGVRYRMYKPVFLSLRQHGTKAKATSVSL